MSALADEKLAAMKCFKKAIEGFRLKYPLSVRLKSD